MKKYEKPEIKEVELELSPILTGSDTGGGDIGEAW